MRLHILSDLHLEFGAFTPPTVDADVVILAGDTHHGTEGLTWALRSFPNRPVIFVAGNHEYYGHAIPNLTGQLRAQAKNTQVHFLENESVCVGDVVFLGATLWTDFALRGDVNTAQVLAQMRLSDYVWIHAGRERRLLRPSATRRWHLRSVRWLKEQTARFKAKKLVIVTHHAPSPQSVLEQFAGDPLNPAFASDLRGLIFESEARLWIHGHIHQHCDYRIGKTRVIANPRGYHGHPEEARSGFNPRLVVDV